MMDSDSSENLEASLSMITYHFILVKEINPEMELPS